MSVVAHERCASRASTPRAILPTRAYDGDAGLDLYALEPCALAPGRARAASRTGIAVEIPPGHAGLVLPRSGLAPRHGIALVNAPGLIDAGYRGELRVLLLNTDRATSRSRSPPGDRIAQLVRGRGRDAGGRSRSTQLGDSERGAGGFGSSGR